LRGGLTVEKVVSRPHAIGSEALAPEAKERLRAVAAMPDDQINLSDPDAPEVVDWSGAVRGRSHKRADHQRPA
jgi:hypothetical protein